MTALFARVAPALKLSEDYGDGLSPGKAGKNDTVPPPVGATIVALKLTAAAPRGTPHLPVTLTGRHTSLAMAIPSVLVS